MQYIKIFNGLVHSSYSRLRREEWHSLEAQSIQVSLNFKFLVIWLYTCTLGSLHLSMEIGMGLLEAPLKRILIPITSFWKKYMETWLALSV